MTDYRQSAAYQRSHYAMTYDPTRPNRCPGCGHSNWLVGRALAECGFCQTAMVIAAPGRAVELEAA